MSMTKIFVNFLGPSTNEIYSGCHWSKRKRAKDGARLATMAAVRSANLDPVQCRVDLTFTPQLGKGARRRDTSNNSMTAKLIEDALVKAGVLADDTDEHVRNVMLTPAEVDRGAATGMWVTISEVES